MVGRRHHEQFVLVRLVGGLMPFFENIEYIEDLRSNWRDG